MICTIPIENEEERKERLELLKKKIKVSLELKKQAKLSLDELSQLKKELLEYKEVETVERCRHSLLEFAYEFFSVDKEGKEGYEDLVIPAGMKIENAPQFHKELCGYLDDVAYSKTGERLAYSVPRGHAKSSYVSQLLVLFTQVFRLKCSRFVLILSESLQGAQKFLDFSRNALKYHERLRATFGVGLQENAKQNERDNSSSYISCFTNPYTNKKTRSLILCSGVGGQLRGAKFGSSRVTLCIGDDLESAKSVNTKELREATYNFWTQTVDPIGEPESSFILIGTCVHGMGLLNSISKRADFKAKTYAAIVQYPAETRAYWDKFEEIYRDIENPNREIEADEYYRQNKEIMDSEVSTLWDRFTYADLMKMKHNMGTRAFYSEMLNIPADRSNSVFSENDIQYYEDHELPRNLEIYAFWDVAITGTGDRNAIIVIGRSRKNGLLYVLDAKLMQIKMHEGLEAAIKIAKRWRPRFFGVEVVQAQIEMKRQLEISLNKLCIYNVTVKGIRPRGNKQYRIESMQPLVENGTLRFKKGQSQQLLIEEMLSFPHGDTDDGIDAMQQCINMIKFRRGFIKKPEGA